MLGDAAVNEKTLMAVLRAAEGFKRGQSAIFRKYDLSLPQYNVLRVLESSPQQKQRISGVSKELLVHVANMTRLVKRLEQEGYIVRLPDPSDERVTILQLTAKGQTILDQVQREKDQNQEEILAGVTQEDRATLFRIAKQIMFNCRNLKT